MSKGLKTLLLLHAIITFAAAIVLIAAPDWIPSAVDIALVPSQYLLSYFLAAAELAMAYLSYSARNFKEAPAIKSVILTLLLFHASTGILELYAFISGASAKIIGNILVRMIVVCLLYYFGVANYRKSA